MNREQYAVARGLFHRVSELSPGQREAALLESDAEPTVVAAVRALLSEVEREDCFEEERLGEVSRSLAGIEQRRGEERVARVGPYEILRPVGRGGMGVVYEGADADGNRLALKLLHAGVVSPEVSGRFRREAKVLRELHHDGIARFFDSGEARVENRDGETSHSRFIAMEFVDGAALRTHASERELDDKARLELLAQACDAVHHAHTKGIVHRDLKPENILVQRGTARVKVLDFGVARQMEAGLDTLSRTNAGALLGTLPYMSPEQVSGGRQPITPRADVYALGVIAFELLTGQLPYDVRGLPIPSAGRVIQEAEPLRAGSLVARFRGPVETVLRRALEKEPHERYPSAAALAEDLRALAAGTPIQARPPSALRTARKLARRHRTLVVAAVGVVLLLLSWVFLATSSAVRESRLRALADRSAEQARRITYRTRLQGAAAALSIADVITARAQLDACDEDRRDWTWRHLDTRLDQSIRSIHVPALADRAPADIAFDPSGDRIWILKRGRDESSTPEQQHVYVRLYEWDLHTDRIELRSEHLGQRGGGLDAAGEYWLRVTGDSELVREVLRDESSVSRRSLPPSDTSWRVAAHGESVVVYDRERRTWYGAPSKALTRLSHTLQRPPTVCGEWLSFNSRGHTRLLRDGVVWTSPPGYSNALAVSPLGVVIATSEQPIRNDLLVRDVEGTRSLVPHSLDTGREEAAMRAAFASDGELCVTVGHTNVLRVWSVPDGHLERSLVGHAAVVIALAFSPGGDSLVSLDRDGVLRLWNATQSSDEIQVTGLRHRLSTALIATPFGGAAVLGSFEEHVVVVDTETREELARTRVPGVARVTHLAHAPTRGQLFLGGQTRLNDEHASTFFSVDTRTGETHESAYVRAHANGRPAIAVDPVGDRVAVQDSSHGLLVWDDLDITRRPRYVPVVAGERGAVAFSPDGRRLAAKSDRDEVSVLCGETLEPLVTLPRAEGVVLDLAFHPTEDLLIGVGRDDCVRLWNPTTGELLTVLRGHSEPVTSIAVSPDGVLLATGSRDRSVRLWSLEERVPLLTLPCGTDPIENVAFSADGSRLMALVSGPRLHIWDTLPRAQRRRVGAAELPAEMAGLGGPTSGAKGR